MKDCVEVSDEAIGPRPSHVLTTLLRLGNWERRLASSSEPLRPTSLEVAPSLLALQYKMTHISHHRTEMSESRIRSNKIDPRIGDPIPGKMRLKEEGVVGEYARTM